MMMQDKICCLFLVLLLIVIQSTSIDLYNRKGNSVLDRKNYDDDTNKDKYDRIDDDYSQQSSYRRDRYSPYGSLSNNYRSRSRWSSPYDDLYDSNDWSPYGYGLNDLLSNFPGSLSPAVFDSGPYLGNGPSCYSLLDPQYPLFSDICGAVPQARYSLPNLFGHLERWQIAQILTTILGPTTPISANPVCTRSLRLLLCPLLFPPCATRYEAPPILPCQPFCRVVKNQCAAPSLDLLPCDLLPPTSDLCPINPTPYSSLLSSFGPSLPLNGGLSPSVLPQSALAQILAQSTLATALSPLDVPPLAFSSLLSPSAFPSFFPPSAYPSGVPSPASPPLSFTSGVPPSTYPSAPTPSSVSSPAPSPSPSTFGVPPSAYSSALTPPGVPSLTLSPLLSISGVPPSAYSSALTPPGVPLSALSPLLSISGVPSSAMPSLLSPSGLPLSPFNPFFNTDSYLADSLTPILVDFPPTAYAQNYRQASRYFPATRSATEKA